MSLYTILSRSQIQEKATQEFTLTGFLCKTPPGRTVSVHHAKDEGLVLFLHIFVEIPEAILCPGSELLEILFGPKGKHHN